MVARAEILREVASLSAAHKRQIESCPVGVLATFYTGMSALRDKFLDDSCLWPRGVAAGECEAIVDLLIQSTFVAAGCYIAENEEEANRTMGHSLWLANALGFDGNALPEHCVRVVGFWKAMFTSGLVKPTDFSFFAANRGPQAPGPTPIQAAVARFHAKKRGESQPSSSGPAQVPTIDPSSTIEKRHPTAFSAWWERKKWHVFGIAVCLGFLGVLVIVVMIRRALGIAE